MVIKTSRMILFILLYSSLLFLWTTITDFSTTLGFVGYRLFTLVVLIFTFIFLLKNYRNTNEAVMKYLFCFLLLGTSLYIITETKSIFQSLLVGQDYSATSSPNFFYFFYTFFCLIATIMIIKIKRERLQTVFHVLDTLFIINVIATLCWKYILPAIVENTVSEFISVMIIFSYPVLDLWIVLLFITITRENTSLLSSRFVLLMIIGTAIKMVGDTLHFYMYFQENNNFNSLADFLCAIALLFIAGASYKAVEDINIRFNTRVEDFQPTIPILHYVSVIGLLLIAIFQKEEHTVLILGLIFTIILILIRDGVAVFHNRSLIKKMNAFNRSLEGKVVERTKQLMNKNKELKKALQQIEYIAQHDDLTGLPNRRYFEGVLHNKVAASLRNPFTILVVDLDRFKHINDTLGHAVGDELLVLATKRIKHCVGDCDFLARYGGDEFTIILEGVYHHQDVQVVANKLLDTLSKTFIIRSNHINITVSIGAAIFPNNGDSAQTLLKNADIAMVKAKDNRNNVEFFSVQIEKDLGRKMEMLNELKAAISKNDFEVYYQGQYNIKNDELIGVEALVRWNHVKYGYISPAQFIPLAEEFNYVTQIDDFVMKEACNQVVAWSKKGYPSLRLGLNLSPQQFRRENLIELMEELIKSTGISPSQIVFEITENVAMYQESYIINKLHEIKGLGVEIAIDDFGTGYSSLSYLKKFPVDKIKIARPFVIDIPSGKKDSAIVKSIISMSQNLGLTVIAEGVEREEQLQHLRELSCEEIQGFIFSKPVSNLRFEEIHLQKVEGQSASINV